MVMYQMTDNTTKVLNFVSKFQIENGYSPSIPEIMGATGIKSNRGVSLQLDKLQSWGFIFREKQSRRAIKVLSNPISEEVQTVKVPLLGEIHAGNPDLADQQIEEYREVPITEVHGRKDAFLLRVKGDSMTRAGFEEGDIIIAVPNPTPNNGDIVVALMPEENVATLKRFKKMEDYFVLLPDSYNPVHNPIIAKQVMIQGKVLGKLAN